MNSAAPSSIIIVRLSALGDVVLMLSVVQALQRACPDTKITWVTSSAAYQILEGIQGIEFIVIDKPKRLSDYYAFYQRLRGRRFEVLFAAQASLRANFLYPFISARRSIGYDWQRAKDAQWNFVDAHIEAGCNHLLDGYRGFAQALGIDLGKPSWTLPLAEQDRQFAQQNVPRGAGPLLIVNCCASRVERTWLLERYVKVINWAQTQRHARVVLTGGAGEVEQRCAEQVDVAVAGEVKNLVGQTTPKQLAALLQLSDCLLAPDTGPVHMAVAVHTPVVGLYAVAPCALSGPYQSAAYSIDKYPEALRRYLRKEPHEVAWGTRVHHPQAMALISAEEVIAQLDKALEQRVGGDG